jgi:two-component system sensor histidine kinase DesK
MFELVLADPRCRTRRTMHSALLLHWKGQPSLRNVRCVMVRSRYGGATQQRSGRTGSDFAVGLSTNWARYSRAAYVALGLAWPVRDLVQAGLSPREFLLWTALLAFTVVALVPARGRAGSRRRQQTWRTTALIVIPCSAWAISSVSEPFGLVWALVPWLAASLIAADRQTVVSRVVVFSVAAMVVFIIRSVAAITAGSQFEKWVDIGPGPANVVLLLTLAAVIPASLLFESWLITVVVQLHEGAADAARLARAEERLRFAADLHDIQGHSLQVIALKAEYMARNITASTVDASAMADEIQSLARLALEQARSVAHGYQAVDLHEELRNARDVLEAAGIRCIVQEPVSDDRWTAPEPLGIVLREGVTNIFRHSHAATVGITLSHGEGVLEMSIENDGVTTTAAIPHPNSGNGLVNLRDRVQRAGGTLTVERETDRFRLHAQVPSTTGATSLTQTPPPTVSTVTNGAVP